MAVAASFGLACSLSVVVLGDESGYLGGENQKMKVAAIEAEWHTEPAAGQLHGVRLSGRRGTHDPCARNEVPWLLGLIATRSIGQAGAGHRSIWWRTRASAS